jgi:EmrB/QacA subfamily drug resistance transporter
LLTQNAAVVPFASAAGVSLFQDRVNQKVAVAVVYVCAMLLNSIDSTVVNVALPTLAKEFNVEATSIESLIIGYLVSLAVFMPASGWLGDRFGYKRIFLLALLLFTGASALCGLAQSLDQLILFRVIQGAGGGLLTPVGMAMLYRTYPPEERVAVARILMFATIVGPVAGPVLGGYLVEDFSWRWIFYVNVPVGIGALLFGFLFLIERNEPTAGRFDIPGFLLAGSGFAATMFALSEGPSRGWGSPTIILAGVAGIVILSVFVWVELRVAEPMVKLRLLTNPLFNACVLVSVFTSAAFLGTLFVVPLYLQEARGASPLSSGLATSPEAIGVVVSTQIVARLYPRIGPRRLMLTGAIWSAVVMVVLSFFDSDTSLWLFRLMMFMLGGGMAYIFLSNQAAGMATISRADTGRASMLFSVQRQIGSAMGVAILSTVMSAIGATKLDATGASVPNLDAYQAAFIAAAVLALIGAFNTRRIPDSDAAVTMVRRPRSAKDEDDLAPAH